MRRVHRRVPVRMHYAIAGEQRGLSRQGAGQREDLRRMPAVRRGLRMGWYLHNAHRAEGGIPRGAGLFRCRRGSRLSSSAALEARAQEPARGPALLLEAAGVIVVIAAMLAVSAVSTHAAGESSLSAEAACTQIRGSVKQLAHAERNQALALHLMSDGKPTALVASRLGELQQQMGNLRQVLRNVRD